MSGDEPALGDPVGQPSPVLGNPVPITVHRVGSRMMLPRRQIDVWLDSGQDPRVPSRVADPDVPTRRRDAIAVDDAYDVADVLFRRVGAERS